MPHSSSPTRPALLLFLLAAAITVHPPLARAADNPLSPAPYAGHFANDKVTVDLSPSGAGYAGTISMGDNRFPATATVTGPGLAGTFSASGAQFDFTATLSGDQLLLHTGTKTYTLSRTPAGARPIDAPQTAIGAAPPAASGFSVLGSESAGQTLFIKLGATPTLESAIVQTADALGKLFGAKPAVSGAFANPPANTRGGALFTAALNGSPVRGWIFCSIVKSGANSAATATVVYAAASASPADISNLFAFMPADLKMETHQFPDGSGSVDLPPGWTTKQQSLSFGVQIDGPAGQTVVMGNNILVNTPDGLMARTAQQNYQTQLNIYQMQLQAYQQNVAARQRYPNILALKEPVKPSPPDFDRGMPGIIFCRYCQGAQEVLQYLYPEMERKGQKAGTPYVSLDKVIEVVPADPNPLITNDKAGVAYIALTVHDGATVKPMRALNRIETYPVQDGSSLWSAGFNVMRAPDATFDADLPVMNAIMTSFKLNMDVVNKQIQDNGAAVRKMGEDSERQLLKQAHDFNVQQAENFNRFENQMAAQSQARHDASSDFIEYIKGVRDVYDTRTGQMTQVDLSDVHGVVNGMNAAALDPNRFVEIPLRYER
jgi:hypothetical protein